MAENDDPFAAIKSQPSAVAPGRQTPLADMERFIVNNLFDTQPKKRAAYLKQLGFEMDPSDDNKYRPLNSNLPFNAEIEPGFGFYAKGGLSEIFKESAQDIGDAAFDLTFQNMLTGAAALKAGAAGGAAGALAGPVGAATGLVLGAIAGGAAGNVAAEAIKAAAGEVVLDENIPQDMKLSAIQSLLTGSFPQLAKGGRYIAKNFQKASVESTKKAIINAASSSGGSVTPEILQKAADNPEMFSREAVEGANTRLSELYRNIFGTSVETPMSTRQLKEGVFRDVVDPLNKQADAEIDRLAKLPEANFKIEELSKPIQDQITVLSNKFDRTSEEDAALSYLRGKLNFLEKKLAPETEASALLDASGNPIVNVTKAGRKEISFKEGREFLKAIQSDAFDREVPGSGFLKQVAGGDPNALRGIADAKAGRLGSPLPEINAQRSKILTTYKNAQQMLTPQNITAAFIGNDTVKKNMVRETVGEMDQVLGTQFSQAIETGGMQRAIEQMYKAPKAFGSGAVQAEAARGFGKGALTGAGAGAAMGAVTGIGIPAGAAVGAIGGGLAGAQRAAALASPEAALAKIQQLTERGIDIDKLLAEPLQTPLSAPTRLMANQAARESAPTVEQALTIPEANATVPPEEEEDPFAAILRGQ